MSEGGKAEHGTIPASYDLQEMPTDDYDSRTEANVVEADATVIFTYGPMTGGSLSTAGFWRKHSKPYLHVNLDAAPARRAVGDMKAWLRNDGDSDSFPPVLE